MCRQLALAFVGVCALRLLRLSVRSGDEQQTDGNNFHGGSAFFLNPTMIAAQTLENDNVGASVHWLAAPTSSISTGKPRYRLRSDYSPGALRSGKRPQVSQRSRTISPGYRASVS